MKKGKKFLIKSLSVMIAISAFLFLGYLGSEKSLKCPQEYKSAETALKAYKKWNNIFWNHNPNAEFTDWSLARYQFYVNHNCQEAMQVFGDPSYRIPDIETEMRLQLQTILKK